MFINRFEIQGITKPKQKYYIITYYCCIFFIFLKRFESKLILIQLTCNEFNIISFAVNFATQKDFNLINIKFF